MLLWNLICIWGKGIRYLARSFSILLGSKDSKGEFFQFFVLCHKRFKFKEDVSNPWLCIFFAKDSTRLVTNFQDIFQILLQESLHTTFHHIHSSIHTLQNLLTRDSEIQCSCHSLYASLATGVANSRQNFLNPGLRFAFFSMYKYHVEGISS